MVCEPGQMIREHFDGIGLELMVHPRADLVAADYTSFPQNLQVVRNRGLGDVKMLLQMAYAQVTAVPGNERHYAKPNRMRERF